MNIIAKLLEYKIKDDILKVLTTKQLVSNNYKEVEEAKRYLRINSGIIFINVMKSDKKLYKIMAKNKENTFVYEYDVEAQTLTMKGERRNAVS